MKRFVNLLPWNYRRRQLIRRRLLQWGAVGVILLLAEAGWLGAGLVQRAEVQQHVAELESEYAPVAELARQLTEGRKALRRWQDHRNAVKALEETRPALTLLGLISRAARACEGRLRIDQLSLQPRQVSPAPEPRSPASPGRPASQLSAQGPSATVTIKGQAVDNLAVAQFVANLRETHAFQRVELKSTAEQPGGQMRLRSYLVECTY